MNQILSVDEARSKKRRNKASIHSILIVFSVFLMVFGIGLTSTGAYSYYKSQSNDEENISKNNSMDSKKPTITVERQSANIINIVVIHDKGIKNVTYTIDNDEPVQIDGEEKQEVKEQVELPSGNIDLQITAQDINGVSAMWQKNLEIGKEPVITLKQEENKIKLIVESKIGLNSVQYYWGQDKQNSTQITINDENSNKVEELIDVLEGTNTLNIIVSDIQGNEVTKNQKVIGDNKPELSIKKKGDNFIIRASDDESLKKIEITLNSNETITENINGKEYTKEIPFVDGENRLTVVVYNANNITETLRKKYTKE